MEAHSVTTQRIVELEAALVREREALAAERERVVALERERDVLRASHERLRLELELLKRRLFLAKAERVDTARLELEFAAKMRALEEVAGTLDMPPRDEQSGERKKGRATPTGRRNLRRLPLEERRIELTDPVLEKLVAEGKAERAGFEESCKLGWQRGGMRRIVIARTKYSTVGADGESAIEAAPVPREVVWRCLATSSLLAHVIVAKFCEGLPLFRLERRFERDGVSLDRGTMSRWIEEVGGALGATVVAAMRKDALSTAFCIATDATGAAIQPEPRADKQRQPCRRGHFFVMIADTDHVLFEYTPRETSAAVSEMFKGFAGYVQADAKSVYDVLFRAAEDEPPDGGDGGDVDAGAGKRKEVACWVHCRRGLWEAAITKSPVAREGLARISRLFDLDATWSDKPPDDIRRLRDAHLRPHMNAFFEWVDAEFELVRGQRGLLRKALGYARRHKDALLRVLEDGRLIMDNNRSERQLRTIAVGRKAWLFLGSDDHAESAAAIFSLVTSARLHRLDPESYIRDVLRVLSYWPKERHLELAPKYWSTTRARLSADELSADVGPITVPPHADASAEQKALPD